MKIISISDLAFCNSLVIATPKFFDELILSPGFLIFCDRKHLLWPQTALYNVRLTEEFPALILAHMRTAMYIELILRNLSKTFITNAKN